MRRSRRIAVAALAAALAAAPAAAVERRPLNEVTIDALTKETQSTGEHSGDQHLALVWWVPIEFWQAVLERDASTPDKTKAALLKVLSGVSLLGVVQADISNVGAFHYYSADAVREKLQVTRIDGAGKPQALPLLEELGPDLEVAIGQMKPILSAAMGNLGRNFHFFVLNDKAAKGRVLDPYQKGTLKVGLRRNDGSDVTARIEMPVNALFVPRKCPNGLDAHVSWKFCPWNGERLPD